MNVMKCRFLIICLVSLCAFGSVAHAQDGKKAKQEYVGYYAAPNLKNILQTLIRNRAVDIYEDGIIDAYARTTACPTYIKNYMNEFEWEKVRGKIREGIKSEVYRFPVAFKYETQLRLDRYNFKENYYPFYSEDGVPFAANTFVFDTRNGSGCGGHNEEDVPLTYKFVLGKTLRFVGLQLTETQGRELFNRMEEGKNLEHFVYPVFYMRVKYIASLATKEQLKKAIVTSDKEGKRLGQNAIMQSRNSRSVVIDVDLDFVEYYEDKARSKLIYTHRP